jgi:hypothetical protein
VTFSWEAPAPDASGAPATAVSASTATLNGAVNPNGSPITDCHFEVTPAPAAGSDVPCAQQIGAGSSAAAVTANVAGLKAATAYRYTLTATTAAGSNTAAPVDFTTATDAAPGAGPGASGPTLTALSLSPSRFHVAGRARHGSSGTTIAFSLSKEARVTVRFERLTATARFKKIRGAVRVARGAGRTHVHFKGIVAGRKLSPGRYRLSVVATDAGGHASKVRHAKAVVLPSA